MEKDRRWDALSIICRQILFGSLYQWCPTAMVFALNLAVLPNAHGQGTFRNLDFEEAQIIPIPGDPSGAVRFDAAFPGWTGYIGNQQVSSTIPNGLPISFNYDPFIVLQTHPLFYMMQGHSMVTIAGSYGNPPSPNWTPASISQTGIIPADARSIRLLTSQPNVPGAGVGLVSLNGVAVSLYYLGRSTDNEEMWGADVASSAGQPRELRLFGGWTSFDDIRFSPSPIPEPGAYLLVFLGVVLLQRTRRACSRIINHVPPNTEPPGKIPPATSRS